MDKTTIDYVKNNEIPLREFSLPEIMNPLHKDYGLSIFGAMRNCSSEAREKVIPRVFRFFGISQLLDGKGWRWTVEEGMEKVSSGSIIITTPDSVHDYGGKGHPFREDALCFSGPIADSLFSMGVINEGVIPICPVGELRPILELSMDPSRVSQIKALLLLQELLLTLSERRRLSDPERRSHMLNALLGRIMEQPEKWWQVSEMAEFCALSESHFRTKFIDHTGVSPKKYVDLVKIQMACEKLSGTRESVTGISRSLGYIDSLHFSKRFKLLTGLSPTSYRMKMNRAT